MNRRFLHDMFWIAVVLGIAYLMKIIIYGKG